METTILPINALVTKQEYAEAFPPVPEADYLLLKEDIRRAGMHTPIIVCRTTPLPPGQTPTYTVLAGHTRLQIHQELGIDLIRASIAVTADERISALFDNVYRRQLDKAAIARYREKEATLRRLSKERIIPALQPIFDRLPTAMRATITESSEEGQEAIAELLANAARQHSRTPAGSSTRSAVPEPPVPGTSPDGALHDKLATLEEELIQEKKTGLQTHNKLSRDLQSARDEHQEFEDRIASLQNQLQAAHGEVNAARIIADERLGRTNGLTDIPPTPQLLLQGLDYAQQLTAHLSLFAAKVPTLNHADALTAQTSLRTITTHLAHLHELLLPTHDGLLPDGRKNSNGKGNTLSLVNRN